MRFLRQRILRLLPLVGLVASLTVADSVLRHAERQGLIVLAIR